MDRNLIPQKLESLRRSVQRIQTSSPLTVEALALDLDAQDIVTLNLTRAVQLAVDIGTHIVVKVEGAAPTTMGETFDLLGNAGVISVDLAARLRKAVGFRNIAVHNYVAISWEIVFSILNERLSAFKNFAQAVDHWLSQQPLDSR
jgi:uncharacterized protein YutE (UPF0331/DUF86 family)